VVAFVCSMAAAAQQEVTCSHMRIAM